MTRDLGGRTSPLAEGEARQWLEPFSIVSIEVRCIANRRARQECTSLFFGCLDAGSMVDGSRAQDIHARH